MINLKKPPKEYSLVVPKLRTVKKKIKYSNPDKFLKSIEIQNDHPDVLKFKDEPIEIAAEGFHYLRMRFKNPKDKKGKGDHYEIHVNIVRVDTGEIEEELIFSVEIK